MLVTNLVPPPTMILRSAKDTIRAACFRGRHLKQNRADGTTAAVEELLAEGVIVATDYDEAGNRIVRGNHQPTD